MLQLHVRMYVQCIVCFRPVFIPINVVEAHATLSSRFMRRCSYKTVL